jgi:pullulanase
MFKQLILGLALMTTLSACQQSGIKTGDYNNYPVYEGNDLWPSWSPEQTTFKIWSPTATMVMLHIYIEGTGGQPIETHQLQSENKGIWKITLKGDYKNKYYTFQVKTNATYLGETPGIYAQATGVNGERAMVVDLESTNPTGWDNHVRPELKSPHDIILYELQIRDMTIHPSAGNSLPGKFTGLIQPGTKNDQGLATGIDHLREIGVTHVHLLPAFDHRSIDETRHNEPQYNWGYDPQNYNVPEGSFSTDPFNGATRIKEFKEMVMGLHENGLRVILDVVYNHTSLTEGSNFNLEVPGYYYRHSADGKWSNASACGNETASERYMMRKFIIESCKYWVREYKIDGFRFDLMGIHDIETMNLLAQELHQIDSSLFIYGEGWKAGHSPLPDSLLALKANAAKLNHIAVFSDDMRDGLKGYVFHDDSLGFVNGGRNKEESVKFGIVASTQHPQINYKNVNYSGSPWAAQPYHTINYVSCHDNHTLYDKLRISRQNASTEEIERMDMLAAAIVMTSQGIPFLHAGEEMLRTKQGIENSFNQPDSINQIDWNRKTTHLNVVNYYKQLVELRKQHPAFRMPSTEMIQKHLQFIDSPGGTIAFRITKNANGDKWKEIIVVFNAKKTELKFELPDGNWKVAVKNTNFNMEGSETVSKSIKVDPISTLIVYQE